MDTDDETGATKQSPELWTAKQAADFLGLNGENRAHSARRQLSRMGVEAVKYARVGPSPRPQAIYDAAAVRAAQAGRPGRGARTDLAPDEPTVAES